MSSRPPKAPQTTFFYLQWLLLQLEARAAAAEAMLRCLQGVREGTSTANQPQWKLHLPDVERLELHVSTAEEGDTAKRKHQKETQKMAAAKETILSR